jgi:phosphoribosylaminoimidazolecarboxamide formyltransferase/IMP cyclohydrolase
MTYTPVKRALLSVSDKTGLVEFAQALQQMKIDIVSTGGTSKVLREAGVLHREVDEVTALPAMLGGRVKTLHPKIHGGILGKRDQHAEEALQHQIEWIDLVVVNFYPFQDALSKNPRMTFNEAVELIDIGGPTMVRAAAKNFSWVGVAVLPQDYPLILTELHEHNGLSLGLRRQLAEKVFALTSQYDAAICRYFAEQSLDPVESGMFSDHLNLQLKKLTELRYGENPHQRACAYQFGHAKESLLNTTQHQGKPLSYNNMLDAEAAVTCLHEFDLPTCVIVKHANPCGVASAETIEEAYQRAYEADSLSAFGGVVAINRHCTEAMALQLSTVFTEVLLAPSFSNEALAVLANKPNLRVLVLPAPITQPWEMRFISGGILLQEKDPQVMEATDLTIVTRTKPNPEEIDEMLFAWRVLKHIKSNGILIAKDNATVGIGAGQVSRVDSVDIALRKAGERTQQAILASDAFFPFRDSIDLIAKTGISAIIQPGGSVRDEEVITACDEHGIAMVFTGKRCFKH